MAEAKLVDGGHGKAPVDEGWFVLNLSDARWQHSDRMGDFCALEGGTFTQPGPRFADVGINVRLLAPGQPASMYHRESVQEGFLVLSGECLLIIDGQERRLRAWDFVHCPANTDHAFIGAGDGPCAILMVGARRPDKKITYPASALAQKHEVGVAKETDSPMEAYAGMKLPEPIPSPWSERGV